MIESERFRLFVVNWGLMKGTLWRNQRDSIVELYFQDFNWVMLGRNIWGCMWGFFDNFWRIWLLSVIIWLHLQILTNLCSIFEEIPWKTVIFGSFYLHIRTFLRNLCILNKDCLKLTTLHPLKSLCPSWRLLIVVQPFYDLLRRASCFKSLLVQFVLNFQGYKFQIWEFS